MKKHRYLLPSFLFLLIPLYHGNAQEITPVAAVQTLPRNSWVFLRGSLEAALQNERYILKDESGELLLRIPREKMRGQEFNSGDTVLVGGEIQIKANGREIDVQYIGSGGTGPINYTMVSDTGNYGSKTWVRLRGFIAAYISGDSYIFRDSSGQTVIHIEDGIWRGLLVNPDTPVEIGGEIIRRRGQTEIRAAYLARVQ